MYLFSTQWANDAADAVVAGTHNSIIQFHKNQRKGPGFHRHPPGYIVEGEDEPEAVTRKTKTGKRGAAAAARDKDGDREEEEIKLDGHKRKNSRANLNTENQSAATKKRKTSIQKDSPSVKTQSPPPFLRSSRRLRNLHNPTTISPSLPPPPPTPSTSDSDEDDKEDDDEEKLKTPSPVPVPAQLSGLSHARATRSSRRLMNVSPPQVDAANDPEDLTASKPSPMNDDSTPDVTRDLEEEEDGQPENMEDGNTVDNERNEAREDAYRSPDFHSLEDLSGQPSDESRPDLDKDNNYTICHGTPRAAPLQVPTTDMSSPKEWQEEQLVRQQQHSLPQYTEPKSSDLYSAPTSESVVSPDLAAGDSVMDITSTPSTLHVQDGRGVNSNTHTSSEHHPAPPLFTQAAALPYQQKDWGPGVLSGHSPYPSNITSGYHPGMYGHPMHGMPYHPPPGQPPMAGHSYPYTMAYSWGHPSAVAASQHQHQQVMVPPQARLGEGLLQGRPGIMPGGVVESPGYPHGHLRPPMHAAAAGGMSESSSHYKEKRKSYSDSPSTSPAPAQGLMGGSAQSRAPGPDMLLLGPSSYMSSRDIPPQHPLTHSFIGSTAAGAHHPMSHDHLPHHPFPYSFEPSAHPSLQMWQQSQMQGQQLRPITGVPHAQLAAPIAPCGLWYGPGESSVPSHLVPSQELHVSTAGKKAGGSGRGKMKRDSGDGHSNMSSNRNSNNNNSTAKLAEKSYVADYQAKAFPDLVQRSSDVVQQQVLVEQGVCNSAQQANSQEAPQQLLVGTASTLQQEQQLSVAEYHQTGGLADTNGW